MVVRRVGVLSLEKVLGALYALLGLIIGAIYALFAIGIGLIGASTAQESGDALAGGAFGVLFGVGSIIFFPIFYGTIGFIGGIISAFLYNIIAGAVGGIELEMDQRGGGRVS